MISVHAIRVRVSLVRSRCWRVDVSHHGGPVTSGKHGGRGQSLLQLLFLFSVLGPSVLKPYLKHRHPHCPMQKHPLPFQVITNSFYHYVYSVWVYKIFGKVWPFKTLQGKRIPLCARKYILDDKFNYSGPCVMFLGTMIEGKSVTHPAPIPVPAPIPALRLNACRIYIYI